MTADVAELRGRSGASVGERLRRGGRSVLSVRTLIVGLVIIAVGYLAVVPLAYLLYGTFTGPGGWTLDAFGRAYNSRSQAGEMMLNSVLFAAGSCGLALILGTALAYVQVRTDAPFKGLFFAGSLVPLVIPSVLYATSWIFLADPTIGLLNSLVFQPVFGSPVLNIFSMWGMVWVEGTHLAPVAFLLMVGAFRAMDPSLEESAAMSGAGQLAIFRRITGPLLRPTTIAAVLLLFVQSLESFEVPAIIGLRNGIYVFTSRIYYELRSLPIDYGAAGAYALGLLVIAAAGVLLSGWLNRNARNYQTITGKAFRPRTVELGRARPIVGGITVLFFAVTVALPLLALVYASLLNYYRQPSVEAFREMSLDTYRQVLGNSSTWNALTNSTILAVSAATIVMVLTAIASWVVVRSKLPGRRVVDLLAFTPLTIPGLVLGLALLFVYLRTPLPIYGTLLILLIAYSTKYLPHGMRYAGTAMGQIGADLEESATVSGASWWQSFRRVLAPLASSGMLAGWVFILIVSFRELSTAILLYSPGNEVISLLIWQQYENGSFPALAAIGVLLVTVLTVLVLIAYRLGASVGLKTGDS